MKVKYEIEKQEVEFLGMILETLGASLLGKMLTRKCVLKAGRIYNNMDHIDKVFLFYFIL